ncbi:MAG: response regulator [Marivivens sp.]|nr:response regulator [Marivivens sp.]
MALKTTFAISSNKTPDDLRDSLLFRDLDGSQLLRLRAKIARHPSRHTLIYVAFTSIWVIGLALGAVATDLSKIAIYFVPHTALFVLVLGVLIYPIRMLFWPILAFIGIYLAQAIIPTYILPLDATSDSIARMFWVGLGVNLFIGGLVGFMLRLALNFLNKRLAPYTVDLTISVLTGVVFFIVSVTTISTLTSVLTSSFPETVAALSLDKEFLLQAAIRCGYGGIVVSTFFIGMIQFPRPSDVLWATPFVLSFGVLATLGRYGFQLHVALDAIALCAIFAVVLPIRLVVPTLTTGMLIYASMTGAIVTPPIITSQSDLVIEIYAVIALGIIIFVLGLRSHGLHLQDQQVSSLRRLNTVRNYAGVGVFAVDLTSRMVSVDPVTQRMLGVPQNFDIASMMRKFGDHEQTELRRMMFQRPGETTTLLARLRETPGSNHRRVIRLFLWYERSFDNTDMRQAVNPEKNLPINPVPFVPADLAESIRNTFEMQAQASGITIRLRFGEGANEMVLADSVRIKQILGNLIRNAIIHSRCSAITVTYRSSIGDNLNDRTGVWSITDNGIGIAAEEVERLFQPFQRGGEDARNRADGSGLGLYIVRTTAQLLGGSVTYFPAPEGGAGYHVRIAEPLASAEDLRQVAHMDDDTVDFGSMYVLLAEDNALVAEVTSARLRKFMGRVEVVGSGREALDLIAQDPPDVVVTDLFMPEMSGDELTRTLRTNGFTKPIIGLTAAVVGDDMRQFEKAGASTVMTKPLDDTALMRFLRKQSAEQDDETPQAE